MDPMVGMNTNTFITAQKIPNISVQRFLHLKTMKAEEYVSECDSNDLSIENFNAIDFSRINRGNYLRRDTGKSMVTLS